MLTEKTMTDIKQPWILVGYDLFSKEGLKGLKIEVIARKVSKSKSSFYHHFADMEVFVETLLSYHLSRAKIIGERERLCKSVVPDLLNLLLEVKQDLLFNRQLRVNRNTPAFQKCIDKIDKEFDDAILTIWADALGLADKKNLARIVLGLTIENFYLQITEKTLTYEWLLNYIGGIRMMVQEIRNSNR